MKNEVFVPNFEVYLNGIKLQGANKDRITQVTVTEDIDTPATFSIAYDIIDFVDNEWIGIELEKFDIGNSIEIYMGMDKVTEMVSGEIDSMNVTFGQDAHMEIQGFDYLHKLTFGKKTRTFTQMSDSQIVNSLASEAGLTPKTDDTETQHSIVTQNNESNFRFLLHRAKRIGYEILVSKKDLIFRKPKENQSPVVTFKYGVDIMNFSIQVTNLNKGSQVEARGWDMMNKEAFVGKASSGDEYGKMGENEDGFSVASQDSKVLMQKVLPVDRNDAGNLAKGKYNDLLLDFMEGGGECNGNPEIRAGKMIKINGLGDKYSGEYYVVQAIHSVDSSGYYTNFKVKKTAI